MKIAIAGISHETHTFLPETTGLSPFDRSASRGQEMLSRYKRTNTTVGGFIKVLEASGVEIVPVVFSSGGVSGTVEDAVYQKYIGEMCEELAVVCDELDGVLLALHGAMVTKSIQDTETAILKDIRKAVGYQMPIMAALDLHGNLDPAILTKADGIIGYRKSPHTDEGETGERAAKALLDMISGKTKPVSAIAKPGLVIPSVLSATTQSPAKDIMDRVMWWQGVPRVIDVSFFFGFAWSDVHQLGASAVAITDNAPELARAIVDDLASQAWARKEAFTKSDDIYSVGEGVALAMREAETAQKPIVILDHSDRLNDTTFVLRELIKQNAESVAFPLLYDPQAASACIEAGVGAQVDLAVGSKSSPSAGGPVQLRGTVVWAGEKTYIGTGPMRIGQTMTNGPTAIVQSGGVWVQLVSRMGSLIDQDPIIQYGRQVSDFKIIVSKSKTHFRAVYEPIAHRIVIVDAPAYSPVDLSAFVYKNVPRGIYPIT